MLLLSCFLEIERTSSASYKACFLPGDMGLNEHKLASINLKTLINIKGEAMKTKDEYIESLAAELKEWSAQIDLLTAKTDKAAADVKVKYLEELDALRAKQQVAAAKMKELEEASGDAWVAVKQTADKVWGDLRDGVSSAASKFK